MSWGEASICKRCEKYSVVGGGHSQLETAEVDVFHRLNAIAEQPICCGEVKEKAIIKFLGCQRPFDLKASFLRGAFALAVQPL